MTIRFEVIAHVHLHASGGVNELHDIKETLAQLLTLENKIMTVIGDFASRQKAFNDRMDAAVDGLTQDVKGLNDKIAQLQSTSGGITEEDQALLDELQERGESMAQKLEALDALTPPTPPIG